MPKDDHLADCVDSQKAKLGIALSGGGSRAAAFHRGTVQGLSDIGLLDPLSVISSVSGGSVFAAAWMAAIWQGRGISQFLEDIGCELAQGFVARSLTLSSLKLVFPSFTRASLLAETFDRTLTHGMKLRDLPARPALCINTSVMNTGQVGKFSREGFSSTGFHAPGQGQERSNPTISLAEYPVALAATASAAFPIGLPPVFLIRGTHVPEGWGGPDLADHRKFALTDGGVLENLGVQTLLKSKRFGTWDIIVSDAGRREEPWKPGGIMNCLRGALTGAISFPNLQRVLTMMNSKENRHMRLTAYGEIELTWLIQALRGGQEHAGLNDFLASRPSAPRRRILFIRVNQTLNELLATIPRWRLKELATRANDTLPDRLPAIEALLQSYGVNLGPALDIHAAMGGDSRIAELNNIGTHFTALPTRDIEGLHAHSLWQVHAMKELYWN